MRLRKIKNAEEIVLAHPNLILQSPQQYQGKWNQYFQNDHPIYLEIGMGKGQFIYTLASINPDINFIGLEKEASVIIKALDKVKNNPLPNLVLLHFDANNILEVFSENEISKIYLNFSDPWPKSRHSKRRLTYPSFLMNYHKILKNDGDIEFKTDNRKLFEYTVLTLSQLPMELLDLSLDLHSERVDVVTTEYENRFIELNHVIYYLKTKFIEEEND